MSFDFPLTYRLVWSTISMSTFRASCAVATSPRKLMRAALIPSFVFSRREKPRRSTEVMVASAASSCAYDRASGIMELT